jgi:hypothetical protein
LFLFSKASRPALRPPSLLSALSPGSEADHSPPSNAKVKKVGAISPPPAYLHSMVLNYTDNITKCVSMTIVLRSWISCE